MAKRTVQFELQGIDEIASSANGQVIEARLVPDTGADHAAKVVEGRRFFSATTHSVTVGPQPGRAWADGYAELQLADARTVPAGFSYEITIVGGAKPYRWTGVRVPPDEENDPPAAIGFSEITGIVYREGPIPDHFLLTRAQINAILADPNAALGITEVVSDGTLAGKGISGDALGVADGAITMAKLANDSVGVNQLADDSVDLQALEGGIRTTLGNVDQPFTLVEKQKLANIERDATADQTPEEIQDIVGAMVDGNQETGGTLTYDDAAGKIDLTVTGGGGTTGITAVASDATLDGTGVPGDLLSVARPLTAADRTFLDGTHAPGDATREARTLIHRDALPASFAGFNVGDVINVAGTLYELVASTVDPHIYRGLVEDPSPAGGGYEGDAVFQWETSPPNIRFYPLTANVATPLPTLLYVTFRGVGSDGHTDYAQTTLGRAVGADTSTTSAWHHLPGAPPLPSGLPAGSAFSVEFYTDAARTVPYRVQPTANRWEHLVRDLTDAPADWARKTNPVGQIPDGQLVTGGSASPSTYLAGDRMWKRITVPDPTERQVIDAIEPSRQPADVGKAVVVGPDQNQLALAEITVESDDTLTGTGTDASKLGVANPVSAAQLLAIDQGRARLLQRLTVLPATTGYNVGDIVNVNGVLYELVASGDAANVTTGVAVAVSSPPSYVGGVYIAWDTTGVGPNPVVAWAPSASVSGGIWVRFHDIERGFYGQFLLATRLTQYDKTVNGRRLYAYGGGSDAVETGIGVGDGFSASFTAGNINGAPVNLHGTTARWEIDDRNETSPPADWARLSNRVGEAPLDAIPDLPASKITSGTFQPDRVGARARLGSQTEYRFLREDGEFWPPPGEDIDDEVILDAIQTTRTDADRGKLVAVRGTDRDALELISLPELEVGQARGPLWATSPALPTTPWPANGRDVVTNAHWTIGEDAPSDVISHNTDVERDRTRLRIPTVAPPGVLGLWMVSEVGGVELASTMLPWSDAISEDDTDAATAGSIGRGEVLLRVGAQDSSTGLAAFVKCSLRTSAGGGHQINILSAQYTGTPSSRRMPTAAADTHIKVYAVVARGAQGIPGVDGAPPPAGSSRGPLLATTPNLPTTLPASGVNFETFSSSSWTIETEAAEFGVQGHGNRRLQLRIPAFSPNGGDWTGYWVTTEVDGVEISSTYLPLTFGLTERGDTAALSLSTTQAIMPLTTVRQSSTVQPARAQVGLAQRDTADTFLNIRSAAQQAGTPLTSSAIAPNTRCKVYAALTRGPAGPKGDAGPEGPIAYPGVLTLPATPSFGQGVTVLAPGLSYAVVSTVTIGASGTQRGWFGTIGSVDDGVGFDGLLANTATNRVTLYRESGNANVPVSVVIQRRRTGERNAAEQPVTYSLTQVSGQPHLWTLSNADGTFLDGYDGLGFYVNYAGARNRPAAQPNVGEKLEWTGLAWVRVSLTEEDVEDLMEPFALDGTSDRISVAKSRLSILTQARFDALRTANNLEANVLYAITD